MACSKKAGVFSSAASRAIFRSSRVRSLPSGAPNAMASAGCGVFRTAATRFSALPEKLFSSSSKRMGLITGPAAVAGSHTVNSTDALEFLWPSAVREVGTG